MTAFAVLRDTAVLRPACQELSALLGLRRQLAPDAPASPLLALWVDPGMAAALPLTLSLPFCLPTAQVRIRETNSRGDTWSLCWLEATADANEAPSHTGLLTALLQAQRSDSPMPVSTRLFIPVFGAEVDPDQVDAQLAQIRSLNPDVVSSPVFQDLRTGRLLSERLP